MFSIEWLRGTAPVEAEISALTDLQRVVDAAQIRSASVKLQHPGEEPDSFQVASDGGSIVVVYPV